MDNVHERCRRLTFLRVDGCGPWREDAIGNHFEVLVCLFVAFNTHAIAVDPDEPADSVDGLSLDRNLFVADIDQAKWHERYPHVAEERAVAYTQEHCDEREHGLQGKDENVNMHAM